MKRLVAAFLTGGLATLSFAQVKTALYIPGHSIKDQAITLSAWGSGTVAESPEIAFEGTTSIRIFSRNYFQGGILTFGKPIDLSTAYDDSTALLELTFKVADSNMILGGPTQPAGGAGGRGGGGGGGKGGIVVMNSPGIGMAVGFQERRGPPGFPGGFPGAPGFPGQAPGQPIPGQLNQPAGAAIGEQLDVLRIIVTTTDNLKSEMYIPISSSFSSEHGWRSTSFPLTAVTGFKRTNKIVKDIAISADNQATFYVGGIRVVSDTTPITGDVNISTLNLALGDKVELKARGYAGSTLLKYEWDFDDRDGIQVDATGANVTRVFNKPGTFTITVTISDLYGQKKPFTKTLKALVNP